MKKKQTKKNLLPRPVRKRRRASEERGLPPDQQLIDLAKSYLEQQSQHWPELAEAGILRPPTDATLEEMVRDYKQRHGSYVTPAGNLKPLQAKLELALPPTTAAPDIRIRIDLDGLRKAGYKIPTVKTVSGTVKGPGGRVYQMPGGGKEMQFPFEIPGKYLEVLPIP
jgi:hypothetical protein